MFRYGILLAVLVQGQVHVKEPTLAVFSFPNLFKHEVPKSENFEKKLKFVIYDTFDSHTAERTEKLLIERYNHYLSPEEFINYVSLVLNDIRNTDRKVDMSRSEVTKFARWMRDWDFGNKVETLLKDTTQF